MKESYKDDIMLCFVQGYSKGERSQCKNAEDSDTSETSLKKRVSRKISIPQTVPYEEELELRPQRKSKTALTKSLRLSSGHNNNDREQPEVKRSFSDRFSVVPDFNGRRQNKEFSTIRKTWSTGNFASSGVAGGAAGSPRSAPSTPLQLEPQPPPRTKHDKQVIKPISTSAPSVRAPVFPQTSVSISAGDGGSDASESGKAPSKARQKKFLRHFPQVGPEEKVLNYYSCALVGDILLQGHLYITKNYFAFYSNVFGYVTKLLIPTTSVVRVTKEKVARIIPNAVGVCTRDERHVFGSLLSRDSAHKLMTRVWKAARVERPLPTPPPSELRISEAELDASEYSPEDESSSGGGDGRQNGKQRDSPAILHPVAGSVTAIIQPALLTGASVTSISRGGGIARALLMLASLLLAISSTYLAFRLYSVTYYREQVDLSQLSGEDLYEELLRWRTKVHGKAASELEAFLSTNLLLLTKVRQSLEALSGIMLADLGNVAPTPLGLEVPNDTYS